MRVMRTLICLLPALAVTLSTTAFAEEAQPFEWPVVREGAQHSMHMLPDAKPAVETGSIENAAPPPNADIGKAARALIPLPQPAEPQSEQTNLDAAPNAATDGPATPPPAVAAQPSPEEADQTALIDLYSSRRDEPLWVTKTGYSDKAKALIAELARAEEWGFDANEFSVPGLNGDASEADLAKAEMELSLALLKYHRFARGGRIPTPALDLSSYLDRRPQLRDRKALMESLVASDDPASVLRSLHPQQPQFELLRQAWLETQRSKIIKLSKIAGTSDIKPGDRAPEIIAIRKRLDVEAANAADADLLDAPLQRALQGFQTLRALSPADGALTAATRTELAKPISKANAEQLAANMQMWRWMPEDLGAFYVTVNIPEYMIRVVKDGAPVFTERVTVGLVDKQTPVFSDQMERVTFKSIWRVPDSIKVNEVWPSLIRGGGLMRQHNLRMKRVADPQGPDVDWQRIDWTKADMGEYFLYRPPGGGNQLGLVKFSFPSKHYVFMHDTPEKFMFNWARRANSHGCMRIRNPLQMAAVILGQDKGWDRAKIDDLVRNGPDHNVIELDAKIPVHITYFTARVMPGGKVETWPDIYGHQKRVTQALNGQYDKIAKGRDHLAPLDQKSVPRVAVAAQKAKQTSKDGSVQSLFSSMFSGL